MQLASVDLDVTMADQDATGGGAALSAEPPYLPPSMLAKRLSWDVFLSFRGEDTRHTITKSLYEALQSNGIRTFIDDEGMERGDVIQPSLEEAIVDSALAVAIISPRYADSRWCLHELSRIFKCQKKVVPVFYRVDPSNVRRQEGEFGKGFWALADSGRVSPSDVEGWRKALKDVGNISGYPCYAERDEPELVSRIVKQVLGELSNSLEYVVKVAVGLDMRVNKVLERLKIHPTDVQFLGIHGTPGTGKTTLAKAVFNKLAVHFTNHCFVSNVRESMENEGGILSILNKLISDLSLGRVSPVREEDDGKRAVRKIVSENRVLIVLDDVTEADQLKSLGIDDKGLLKQGSRVVVTSRDIGVLDHVVWDEQYEGEEVLRKLGIHSTDVWFLSIHGTPGIGKTTLAKAAFNKMAKNFKNRCFVSNVRESLKNGGILSILNKLITDLSLGKVHKVMEEGAGKEALKKIVKDNRVLIMLDDVSETGQLKSLGIDDRQLFGKGSRIVVTSRNIGVLDHVAGKDELYEAEELNDLESLELFSIHALGRREPTEQFRTISERIVSLTGGLPLALEVFGSYLVKKTEKEWEDALEKLRHIRPKSLQDLLKLSYDGLDEQEKTIFLDISCLLLQAEMKREELVDVIESCGLNGEIAIGNLVTKSLLKIREGNRLWMHDQIRDMGKQMVMDPSSDNLGRQSRLWNFCDILSVLRQAQIEDGI